MVSSERLQASVDIFVDDVIINLDILFDKHETVFSFPSQVISVCINIYLYRKHEL